MRCKFNIKKILHLFAIFIIRHWDLVQAIFFLEHFIGLLFLYGCFPFKVDSISIEQPQEATKPFKNVNPGFSFSPLK